MNRKVPMNETANPTATHSASRTSRNRVSAASTSASPSSAFSIIRPSLPDTSTESSFQISTPTPGGRGGDNLGGEMLPDSLRYFEDFLVRRAVYIDGNRSPAVVAYAEIGVLEPVPHGCDLTQAHRCPIRTGQDDDVLEIGLVVVPAQSADEDFLLAIGDPAG